LEIEVLRIGHRFVRDDRTLVHLCLVSRALGARAIYLQEIENELKAKVEEVNRSWGGKFEVAQTSSWKEVIKGAKGRGATLVHLSMYGIPLLEKIQELRRSPKILLIVGGPKVPGDVYRLADHNVSVTSQPHSEIAAVAIMLHELQQGEELKREFGPSKLKIVPQKRGKQVELRA
jgi:tRNA (cytidine56-2'-O)-methyltransferase